MSHKWFPVLCAFCVLLLCASFVLARGPMVSAMGNKHNLSAANTAVTYRATDDIVGNPLGQQICVFCHTPHNAQPQGPLWNRKDTTQIFARYTSDTLQIRNISLAKYDSNWQPNGSSRLCLSCHDGVTPLGAIINSSVPIAMSGNNNVITGVASFKPDTNKMKTGHHPVSFVYATEFNYGTQNGTMIGLDTNNFRLPSAVSMQTKVKLQEVNRDKRGWMQCTTCHDAHQNIGNDVEFYPETSRKITPFWVYSGATSAADQHDAVCSSCHKASFQINGLDVNGDPTTSPYWPTP